MNTTFARYTALLRTYLGPQWLTVAGMVLLLLASIGLQLVGPQVLRAFIDTVQHVGSSSALTAAALLFLGTALGSKLVAALATYWSEAVAWTATNQLRTDLTLHCLNLDLAFHKERTPGELLERVDGDVGVLAGFFSHFAVRLLGNVLLLIGILVLVLREDRRIGLLFAAYTLISLFAISRVQSRATPAFKALRQAQAKLSGFFGEVLAAREDVASLAAGGYVLRRYFGLQRLLNRATLRSSVFWAAFEVTWEVLDTFGTVLVLAAGALLFLRGAMTLGTVFLLYRYAALLVANAGEITEQFGSLQQARAAIERVVELFHTTSRLVEGTTTSFPSGALAVAFEHVSYRYTADQPVLRDVSFQVAPGSVLGLVGRTGSGKTTLTRLVVRFSDPDMGIVRLGGQDLRRMQLSALRRHVAIVTQEVQLFQGTVRANLTFFDRAVPDGTLLAAIERLGLHHWYARLPQGLDTEITAASLSAGEAQLLAFVRVLLTDPRLIILDEASSRLDPATERLLAQAMAQLVHGRTGIIVAHRLATLDSLDDILVLEAGSVVEFGRRSELAQAPTSRYATLLRTVQPEGLLP